MVVGSDSELAVDGAAGITIAIQRRGHQSSTDGRISTCENGNRRHARVMLVSPAQLVPSVGGWVALCTRYDKPKPRVLGRELARGYQVRVMVRAASPEQKQRWPDAEIVVANALELESVRAALEGIHTAYYLIHSMLLGPQRFEAADIRSAANFRKAAEEKKVKRIIYLGGLGDILAPLSPHLRSRTKVAEELRRGEVPATILRAAMIIGSGSASYEIIEHMVKNLPILPVPKWAGTKCQPIGIRDVIKYLVGVLEMEATSGKSFDIGGPDILTLEVLLKILADLLRKRRLFVRSPISSTGLYSYLVSLVTPVPAPVSGPWLAGVTGFKTFYEVIKY